MSSPDRPPNPIAATAPAALTAKGLGVRTPRGVVFADVDIELSAGELLSVCGPAGSGRTMLLLALCGQAGGATGTLTVAGSSGRAAIRRRTSVAPTGGALDLEPDLTVGAHEQLCLAFGGRAGRLDDAAAVIGLPLCRDRTVRQLPAVERTLLALALATVGEPAVIVADDVDHRVRADDRARIGSALRALADSGPAVVAASLDPFADADAVLALGGAPTAARTPEPAR